MSLVRNKKIQVYFHEFNIPTDNTIYFPYSSGLLRAYCDRFEYIKENFEFMPFLFMREPIDKIMNQYDSPDIACFSSSIWNHQLNLKIAQIIKEKYPKCLIVFGGPQVPITPFIGETHPFIDVAIFGEGEREFKKTLDDYLNGVDFEKITKKQEGAIHNLDDFPSPYTLDYFSYLFQKHSTLEFKAIVETNRSCPFKCSFCFWGQSDLNKKIVSHSFEYLRDEADWLGKHGVKYVFCADANFGMYKRDITLAQMYVEIKKKWGYPEKFRVCYGKNATDLIFQTAKVLSKANLSKTVTLALQSVNPEVLKNIGRSNIKKETFVELQKKYTAENIPTYTEIILGLPGETVQTFLDGLEFVLQSSMDNQVFIYHCQILPNTEMARDDYIKKYNLKTIKVPLAETHGSIRDTLIEQEYENIIIESNSMNTEEWKRCAVLSWLIQLFYSLKVGNKIVQYLHQTYDIQYTQYFEFLYDQNISDIDYFKKIAKSITEGNPRCQTDSLFGNIYYEPEELLFLYISRKKSMFYGEIFEVTKRFLKVKNIQYDVNKLKQIFTIQSKEIPDPEEYSSSEEYATQVILHGRKSNFNKPIGFQLI